MNRRHFTVVGRRLTGNSQRDCFMIQTSQDLRSAERSGLTVRLQALACSNAGQWDSDAGCMVYRWSGADGLIVQYALKTPATGPLVKVFDVHCSEERVLHIERPLDGVSEDRNVVFHPGSWVRDIVGRGASNGKVLAAE